MRNPAQGSDNSHIMMSRWMSPAGELSIGSSGDKICLCDWTASPRHASNLARLQRLTGRSIAEGMTPAIADAIAQLSEYFDGRREAFTLPLLLLGTEFQLRVRRELLGIPYGATVTYGRLAQKAGRAAAVRAAATACATNPLSILVPCHRVVGADGSLTGYAGGLAAKRFLLTLEQK